MSRRLMCLPLLIALPLLPGACEESAPKGPHSAGIDDRNNANERAWHEDIVPVTEDDPEMNAAIATARETAEEARLRWQETPQAMRRNWAVKWGVRVADAGGPDNQDEDEPLAAREHVWVIPLHWSPFRVEGLLASEPRGELPGGAKLGDPVSFPIEELTDWVHYLEDGPLGRREGGFTIEVLERRSG